MTPSDQIPEGGDKLYGAALAVDQVARLADPLHTFSDVIIPAAQFKQLCIALREYERAKQ